jgi:hypothetical protein
MTDKHQITPPPELKEQWRTKYTETRCSFADITNEVARWGADQRGAATEAKLQEARDKELEACVQWITEHTCFHPNSDLIKDLRAARRPKPPSLKEQALAALGWLSIEPCLINGVDVNAAVRDKYDTIRKALEALPND